jgi:hypothetical protein
LSIPIILLGLLLAQIGWQGEARYPMTAQAVEARVDSLATEYYSAKYRFYPALATLRGVPGYDDDLSTYSGRSIFGLLARMRNLRKELTVFDEDSLSMTGWVEYQALLADMDAQRFILEDLEVWKSRPDLYVDACAEGIAGLFLLSPGRIPAPNLNPRLRKLPQVLQYARINLKEPSRLHCRVAGERLIDLMNFLQHLQAQPLPDKDPELIRRAIAALQGFATFVDSLAFSADPGFALSYDEFMLLLDTRNMISETPEALRAYAEGVLETVDLELDQLPKASTEAVAITPANLNAEADSIWKFIRRKDLVGLPRDRAGFGPGVSVMEMPAFARRLFGDMLYVESSSETGPGYLTTLFIRSDIAGPGITLSGLAASEIFPGRHLQALWAAMAESPIARNSHDIFAINGWDLYCQELMARQGFGGAGALRAALERKCFYAAGAVAAVNLLLGEATLDEAADFLAEQTGISDELADEAALQYALEPEQPISYIIGERQISRIRDEVSRIRGDGFRLKTFHDDFLACGRLPLYLIRNSLVTGSVGRR